MKQCDVIFDNVSYTYPDGTEALKNVDLEIGCRETVGIVGANGVGKTTLAHLMVGIIRPASGKVTVGGLELNSKNITEIRRRAGLVFQNADDQLFMPTVQEDVAFGPMNRFEKKDEIRTKVEEVIRLVGLAGLENKFPGNLSGGQKKAAAIAAVIVSRPQILILDEPAAGLDPRSRKVLMELLSSLDQTKILISHDLEMILDLCGEVILLGNGTVAARGKPLEILGDKQLVEENGLEVPYSMRKEHKHRFRMEGHPHN